MDRHRTLWYISGTSWNERVLALTNYKIDTYVKPIAIPLCTTTLIELATKNKNLFSFAPLADYIIQIVLKIYWFAIVHLLHSFYLLHSVLVRASVNVYLRFPCIRKSAERHLCFSDCSITVRLLRRVARVIVEPMVLAKSSQGYATLPNWYFGTQTGLESVI